jgi:purine-binding chemotaxis protein CheW
MSTATPTTGITHAGANANKFLSFCLGAEQYGVEILRVREIIGLIAITPLPQAPDYVKGVMNLRGRIIPVIDLRAKFGLARVDATKETCIIVMEGGGSADATSADALVMGVVVDSVREVQDIPREHIEPAPEFGCSVPLDYIQGMGKVKERVVILLNISRVLSTSERAGLGAAVAQADSIGARKAA